MTASYCWKFYIKIVKIIRKLKNEKTGNI